MRPLHKDIIGSAGEWKGRGEAGYWEVSRALSRLSAVAGQAMQSSGRCQAARCIWDDTCQQKGGIEILCYLVQTSLCLSGRSCR